MFATCSYHTSYIILFCLHLFSNSTMQKVPQKNKHFSLHIHERYVSQPRALSYQDLILPAALPGFVTTTNRH